MKNLNELQKANSLHFKQFLNIKKFSVLKFKKEKLEQKNIKNYVDINEF